MPGQIEMMDKLLQRNSGDQPMPEQTDVIMEILKLLRQRTGAALTTEEVASVLREAIGAAPTELEVQKYMDLLGTMNANQVKAKGE